jgi:hypothetical protein
MDDQRANRDNGGLGLSQCSAMRLLGSAALLAVGSSIVWLSSPLQFREHVWPLYDGPALCWLLGGTLIGAGVFAPFNGTVSGAKIGFAVQLLLLISAIGFVLLVRLVISVWPLRGAI